MMQPLRRYAVFGNPVHHSRSPWLHRYFAAVTQRPVAYAAESVPLDGFAAAADSFFAAGGCGLNITVPFKADALRYAARASAFAEEIGVANVLMRRDEGVVAYNTDGAGFLRALRDELPDGIGDKSVLLIGAGGAARAVAAVIGKEKPPAFWLSNRTIDKAAELAELCGAQVVAASDELPAADIIINATSAGHGAQSPSYPSSLFKSAHLAYDLSYGAAAASFLQQARNGGAARTADGAGMLAWQAALSFALWEGVLPSVPPHLKSAEQ